MDGDIGFTPIYVFALEFIQTAMTTVGFGSHSYQTRSELLFVCFIEVLSVVYTASLIALAAKFDSLLTSNNFYT